MIDIHSHILWGMDDGARDREQSLAMLRMAKAHGTVAIVATPHANHQYRFNLQLVTKRIADLAACCGESIVIHRGCDFHLSYENVQDALANPRKYTIGGHGALLVEFQDFTIPAGTEQILSQFLDQGMVPVVTHPERNPILRKSRDRLQSWIQMGCVLQVTAQSLTDRFGIAAQKSAWALLGAGMVHCIASDAHDLEHRPPRLDIARDPLTREFGSAAADLLLQDNPYAIVHGLPVIAPAMVIGKKRRWFHFWSA